jgi:hypothetical protein
MPGALRLHEHCRRGLIACRQEDRRSKAGSSSKHERRNDEPTTLPQDGRKIVQKPPEPSSSLMSAWSLIQCSPTVPDEELTVEVGALPASRAIYIPVAERNPAGQPPRDFALVAGRRVCKSDPSQIISPRPFRCAQVGTSADGRDVVQLVAIVGRSPCSPKDLSKAARRRVPLSRKAQV